MVSTATVPFHLPAVAQAALELEEAIRAYDDGGQPSAEWWGVVINRLWRCDHLLNPRRLPFGNAHRDEDFLSLPVLQSGPLSRIRGVVDAVAVTFGLAAVMGRKDLEDALAVARELSDAADYPAICVQRDWGDRLHSAAAALEAPVEVKGKTQDATGNGVSWQEAKDLLEVCRINGERFKSRARYAEQFGCSPATIQKAIDRSTVELQQWAARERGESRLNMSPEAAAVVLETTPQSRELAAGDVIEQGDIDVMLARLLDDAKPDERARINAMTPAEQRQLAETAYRDPELEEQALRHRKGQKLKPRG